MRLKPTKNWLETLNSFVSVFMVKMCHNPMHLTNYKECLDNTYNPFLPKEAKINKTCLEAFSRFVSVSMVKLFQNPMHLTNYKG